MLSRITSSLSILLALLIDCSTEEMSSSTPAKSIKLTEKQVFESIETFMKWFPEETNRIKAHHEAIVRCIVDGRFNLNYYVEEFYFPIYEVTKKCSLILLFLYSGTNPEIGSSLLAQTHAKLLTTAPYVTELSVTPCEEAIGIFLVNAVMLAIGLVGLHVSNQERLSRALLQELGQDTLRGFARAIHNFNTAEGAVAKAKALFTILSQVYKAGGFRAVFKVLKEEMSWWEWLKTGVIAMAQISAWFLTDGAAFIAEAALSIMSAEQLLEAGIKVGQTCSC